MLLTERGSIGFSLPGQLKKGCFAAQREQAPSPQVYPVPGPNNLRPIHLINAPADSLR